MVELRQISKIYASKGGQVSALVDVDLVLPANGLIFVLGKSGCGKTTLLNMIGGLDDPTSGKILVDGEEIGAADGLAGDLYRNYKVGFVFQEYNLIDGDTVGQNVGLALELQKASNITTKNTRRAYPCAPPWRTTARKTTLSTCPSMPYPN